MFVTAASDVPPGFTKYELTFDDNGNVGMKPVSRGAGVRCKTHDDKATIMDFLNFDGGLDGVQDIPVADVATPAQPLAEPQKSKPEKKKQFVGGPFGGGAFGPGGQKKKTPADMTKGFGV